MTPQEHLLMISMFARYERFIRTLVDILKSRAVVEGRPILEPDDMKAYEALIFSKERETAAGLIRTQAVYREVATMFGLDIGIEPPDKGL